MSFIVFHFVLSLSLSSLCTFFFFFNDTATTEIYTLSLHDALPISSFSRPVQINRPDVPWGTGSSELSSDRKSTRLNSSHSQISYAVFCLKKKKKQTHSKLQITESI